MHKVQDTYFKVLDDGFIALKDYMGSDVDIEQSARVSYGKGTRKITETRGLLRYLMRHRHSTPFEMCELKFHIRAPIYVYRQWHRHRTWSYNEYSGRYSEMIDSCQQTKHDEWRSQSKSNKQGSGDIIQEWPSGFSYSKKYKGVVEDSDGNYFCAGIDDVQDFLCKSEKNILQKSREVYEKRLKLGVAKEQARKDLPVSNYSEMYAKVDLKNLFGFLSLRSDSHAQQEIRAYSDIMAGIVKELFPLSFEAWYDYHFGSIPFSVQDRKLLDFCLINLLNPKEISESLKKQAKILGMSDREVGEFVEKMNFDNPDFSQFDLGNYEILPITNEI